MPFPDPDTGLIYQPENENSISFTSEFLVYNPRLKYTMNFPGIDFCGDNGGVMLLVGTFPAVRKKAHNKQLNLLNNIYRKRKNLWKLFLQLKGLMRPSILWWT